MKIQRINIQNYKSMAESGDIYINSKIFALIGQNNTGKSTILDAIQCVFPTANKKVEQRDFYDRRKEVVIEIEFTEVSREYVAEKLCGDEISKINNKESAKDEEKQKKLIEKLEKKIDGFIEKYCIFDETMIVKLTTPFDKKKTTEIGNNGDTISDADLKKILPELKVIPAIRNPQNESTAGSNSYLKDLIQMLDDGMQTDIKLGETVVNYNELNRIIAKQSNKRCEDLSKKISKKYSEAIGNDEFKIVINSDVNLAKGTSYTTKIIDKETDLESDMMNCGTGYQSMIILAILETYVEFVHKKTEYILIIEEPEVYLHPTLQRKMIETLMNLAKENQVLFSTHSAITVSNLRQDQIALVVKKQGKAKVEKIDIKKVIDELGIRPDDILLREGTILVEGPDDKKIIEELLRKIDPMILNKIDVVQTGSCANLKFYANAQRIFNTVYTPKTLIIRDADAKNPKDQKNILYNEIKKLAPNIDKKIKDNIFIVGKHALESLFMDETLITKMIDVDKVKCKHVLEIFNKVYDYKKKSGMKEEEFVKYYQPKYFFEKDLDNFGYDDRKKDARDAWEKAYYKNWNIALEQLSMENYFEEFRNIRERLNGYTKNARIEKRDYMLEIVTQLTVEELQRNLFSDLFKRLKAFVEEVKE